MISKNAFLCLVVYLPLLLSAQVKINRQALVQRHLVTNHSFDTLSALTVGNGKFAFTVDATGLQSFPEHYRNGVSLGTQSEWGWHSFENTTAYSFSETLRSFKVQGKHVTYPVQDHDNQRQVNSVNWFRENPHRLQLATIGFEFLKNDGTIARITDLSNVTQTLDMWTGEITSRYVLDGEIIEVITVAHQREDAVSIKIASSLLSKKQVKILMRFSHPTGEWGDRGLQFKSANTQNVVIKSVSRSGAVLERKLDSSQYFARLGWSGIATINPQGYNGFEIHPGTSDAFEFSCVFSQEDLPDMLPTFTKTLISSRTGFSTFWQSGAAVDFSDCSDSRAKELERRVVLSQYLTKVQCTGNYPPQETGLTYNSWYGRPHLEMHWWHGTHFALWGRQELLRPSVDWYKQAKTVAETIASRQGYEGVRWQKMTDNSGSETPSSVGAFLIWQQPHYIYFSELMYRSKPSASTLKNYAPLVFATADFIASYAQYDSLQHRYVLGPLLIPAQERFKPETTINPSFELAYWKWALITAQKWRKRLGLSSQKQWKNVADSLSPLPIQNGKYLFTEDAIDSYTNPLYNTDHPSVLAALGMLPETGMIDPGIMNATFDWIWKNWQWNHTWGWDFPMTAMCATRLGLPHKAVDALLMDVPTNTYLNNGHNYQDRRLTIYLPGNGALLAAVAMMCAGYDGSETKNPGFPDNGKWNVRWEGLQVMP